MKSFSEAFDPAKFQCYPEVEQNHQPWNGTDNYLYTYLINGDILFPGARIIILNDETGVLTYLLREYKPTVTADSIFAKLAIDQNFRNNNEDISQFSFVDSVSFAEESLEKFDIVLIKIPRYSRYLVDQIASLSRCTTTESIYVSSGMVKHVSKHCSNTLSKRIGETTTHRVEKKAVLFTSTPRKREMKLRPTQVFEIPPYGEFISYSNTFSTGKLDKGTAMLLKNIPENLSGHVVDLGSGYGIIARYLKLNCPDITELAAVDSSRMAAESTLKNAPGVRTLWDDGLTSFEDDSIDAVVSNPPFHHDNSFSVNMGVRLFKQVKSKLKPGGTFIMVANTSLNYRPYLKKLFSDFKVLAEDRLFAVYMVKK